MDTGYEMEPGPLGSSSRRRVSVLVSAVAILLAILLVKPWAGTAVAPARARSEPSAAIPIAPPAVPIPAVVGAVASNAPAWPAAAIVAAEADSAASEAADERAELAMYAGSWGVGSAGVGPRILREEPWFDWAATAPETVRDYPAHIPKRPGTGICAGVPTIYDRPSLVAITAPAALAPGWRLVGWWTDGGHVASLESSIRRLPPAGNPRIGYLERTDRARWPPGLYEFHVISGRTTVGLTVCLTRRG